MPKSKLYAWKCSCGTNMKWLGKLKGGGVRARYSRKHDIEIIIDPKSTPSGPPFWLGFEPPDPIAQTESQKSTLVLAQTPYTLFLAKKVPRVLFEILDKKRPPTLNIHDFHTQIAFYIYIKTLKVRK